LPSRRPLLLDDGDQGGVELCQQVLALLVEDLVLRKLEDKLDDEVPDAMFLLVGQDLPPSLQKLLRTTTYIDCFV
jgi:hypothetical protein